MLVRELRRILDSLPANLEIFADIPGVEELKSFSTEVYFNQYENCKDELVAIRINE